MDECIIKPERIYCYGNLYRFELTVYFMTIFSLTLKINTYREVGSSEHGKYAVDGINERDKFILRNKWIVYKKISTHF